MQRDAEKINKMIQERDAIIAELNKEVNMYKDESELDPALGEAYARQMIRSAFASIEAALFNAKYLAYTFTKDLSYPLADTENRYFREIEKKIGLIEDRIHFPTLEDNSNFIFSYLPRLAGVEYPFQINANFRDAVEIRHRVTHPKTLADITVNRSHFHIVFVATNWWFERLDEMMGIVLPIIRQQYS